MSMTFQVLKDRGDLEFFAQRSCALVGNQVPVEYFQSGHVVGAYIDGQMVGGWALSYPAFGPLRCVSALPDDSLAKSEINQLMEQGQICEFTQVWLDPQGANSRHSVRFWTHLAADILTNATPHIIFGFKSHSKGLHNLYSRVHPRLIYKGPMAAGARLQSHPNVSIMLLQRGKFRFLVLRNLYEIVRRMFRKQRGIQRLVHQPLVMTSPTLKLRKLG